MALAGLAVQTCAICMAAAGPVRQAYGGVKRVKGTTL